jgi:hypothetical protein
LVICLLGSLWIHHEGAKNTKARRRRDNLAQRPEIPDVARSISLLRFFVPFVPSR